MSASPDLSKVAGSDSMAAPTSKSNGRAADMSYAAAAAGPSRDSQPSDAAPLKKKRHRAGKKRRNRRQSFIAPSDTTANDMDQDQRPSLADTSRPSGGAQTSFYRLKSAARSNTSLESEALLDHRDQQPFRPRRQSIQQSMQNARGSTSFNLRSAAHRPSHVSNSLQPSSPLKTRAQRSMRASISEDDEEAINDRTPLITPSQHRDRPGVSRNGSAFKGYGSGRRSPSNGSSRRRRSDVGHRHPGSDDDDFDVNNPPSVPGSPKLGSLDDVMIAEEFSGGRSPTQRDAVIDIDRDASAERFPGPNVSSPAITDARRRTVWDLAENDVCYPGDVEPSEIGEEEFPREERGGRRSPRRRRARNWPDINVLDEWSREEKEERNQEHMRAKKISEPVMVGGRLRPTKTAWHREMDDAPYRYTYFNENLDGTIHSRTISELCQFGASFRELFVPDPPELSDDSDYDDDDEVLEHTSTLSVPEQHSGRQSRVGSTQDEPRTRSGSQTPQTSSQTPKTKEKRYGPRPTFWLDVLSPTETEMKVLAKAFGIHQLTTEDILMQEPREKVELFQSYYFVNYRSFEQDENSDEYMEPVNMYVVVFREGVISFHFSMTPHPANVRRRIRQLNDYMSPTADWVSYAVIDDITDVFAPLVQQIEDEVDEIDDAILALHSSDHSDEKSKKAGKLRDFEYEKLSKGPSSDTRSEKGDTGASDNGGDMLRRVGECRKKVMSLYRLLGNKADVIKGFAKRCNEHWEVAPRSEIGLYLGDIQDHIITMTGNLSHYENLLSRAHSNYLAQINIRMNERAEQTNDVLGKLTVLGTIVLPMNIVTGMWGMNVLVPGQDVDSLTWFWCLAGGLVAFGLLCYSIARRVYGIV
ncbi:hypothetical protein MBLNU459_g1469t1 [Dothideomycetes sp. NU459]